MYTLGPVVVFMYTYRSIYTQNRAIRCSYTLAKMEKMREILGPRKFQHMGKGILKSVAHMLLFPPTHIPSLLRVP